MTISPRGMNYHEIKAEGVVVMDLMGKVNERNRKPSVEYSMHRIFYPHLQPIFIGSLPSECGF